MRTVDELVSDWTRSAGSNQHLAGIRRLVRFLDRELYYQYQPVAGKPPFDERLAKWLQNVDGEKDRRCLLELVPWLLFIGQAELETMYQAVFAGPIIRWIIDESGLSIADPDLTENLETELDRTLFGSIAGMEIGSFIKINSLSGHSFRPNFREYSELNDADALRALADKIQDQGYVRVVAVEDMVGTGMQMVEAAPALANLAPLSVLFSPIIVAPAGVHRWHSDPALQHSNLSFSPLFVIPENATIPRSAGATPESHEIVRFRKLLTDTWGKVEGATPDDQLYGPFGYGHFGSLVLSNLNCPDNVPPLVHYDSDQWSSLFPRVPREK